MDSRKNGESYRPCSSAKICVTSWVSMEYLQQIPSNPVLERLPKHLWHYIVPQSYENYTAIDQATWRFVMYRNVKYLKDIAHESYLEGLKQTGISIDQIPDMYGMNRILKSIGWAAVAVKGFIPPAVFMEFQAYQVLVIATDIRPRSQLTYTPAPDIIHEAAGHAPIIANTEYAEYLRRFGALGAKAIGSKRDYEIYEAVRHLSQLKELEEIDAVVLKAAEDQIQDLQQSQNESSELQAIRNLHWWTVEYGLIGNLNAPKIYGAGLLSSIGESHSCLKDSVTKIPLSIATVEQPFDITQPQPHLYVTPNFAHLSVVLESFAHTLSLRCGGAVGVQKLINSEQLGTVELSSGLQISGCFTEMIPYKNTIAYIQTMGPTALSYRDRELIGHGTLAHPEGYGTALGPLKGISTPLEQMSPLQLDQHGIFEGKQVSLEFESGIKIEGLVVTGARNVQGKILVIEFRHCSVRLGDRVLFDPSWGIYHLGVGERVISACAGAADPDRMPMDLPELKNPPISDINSYTSDLELFFQSLGSLKDQQLTAVIFLKMVEKALSKFSSEITLLEELYRRGRQAKLQIPKKLEKQILEIIDLRPELLSLYP